MTVPVVNGWLSGSQSERGRAWGTSRPCILSCGQQIWSFHSLSHNPLSPTAACSLLVKIRTLYETTRPLSYNNSVKPFQHTTRVD